MRTGKELVNDYNSQLALDTFVTLEEMIDNELDEMAEKQYMAIVNRATVTAAIMVLENIHETDNEKVHRIAAMKALYDWQDVLFK